MIKFLSEDAKTLCHVLGQMLVELQVLHDDDVCCHALAVMFDRETDDLVHAQSDVLNLHVLFVFGNIVSDASEATEVEKGEEETGITNVKNQRT